MLKIGIYGGSFDPVHNDHILICEKFCETFALDFTLIIPAKLSPFKNSTGASGSDRLKMLEIACDGKSKVKPCGIELELEGKSYTYRTIELLRQKYPNAKFYLLMGADNFSGFLNWAHPEKIVNECEIVVAGRYGEGILDAKKSFENAFEKKVHFFDLNTSLASSYIRELIKLGVSCKGVVHCGVEDYFVSRSLYKGDKFYEYLKQNLKPERLRHTAGVAYLAEKYAKKIGESADKARIAGLLHDVAKYMHVEDFKGFSFPSEINGENVPPQIVHQFLGAYVAENVLGVTDENVLNAIRWHTTGRINMSMLEKIVFLADLLEPSRGYEEVEFLRKKVDEDFESGFRLTLTRLVCHLEKSGQPVYHLTLDANQYYNGKK